MIRTEFRKALENQQQVLVILWVFFLCGIFLYLWITEFVLSKSNFSAGSSVSQAARVFLWLLAFLDLGTLVWWRRFLTKEAILGGAKKYKRLQALREHSSPHEEQAAGMISYYVTSKIVAFAIIEAIAIYGFVLAVVGRYIGEQYLFSLAAAALMIVEFPSKARFEKLLREIETDAGPERVTKS